MSVYILKNERLRVSVAAPSAAPNTTHRFDRAGFVTSVLLDGRYEFCTSEPDGLWHPCTGGMGLCSELQSPATAEAAQVGEKFAKFGVGLLTKQDSEDYVFHRRYDVDEFEITVEQLSDTELTFTTAPKACGGCALAQKKTLRLCGTRLVVEYEAKNVGKKTVEFTEYCHNFVTIDRLPLGVGYKLEFPTVCDLTGRTSTTGPSTLIGEGKAFTFTGAVPSAEMTYIEREDIGEGEFCWKLSHAESDAWMSETDDFAPANVPLWFIDHMISPEVMKAASIPSGATEKWTRTFEFGC